MAAGRFFFFVVFAVVFCVFVCGRSARTATRRPAAAAAAAAAGANRCSPLVFSHLSGAGALHRHRRQGRGSAHFFGSLLGEELRLVVVELGRVAGDSMKRLCGLCPTW